ncbi:MAG: undecaprenyl-diphosphate phosphatase [Clostridia bacterium]|nr:undecaprenyl-diphosphate phosphatase [Clostridia bacterium]
MNVFQAALLGIVQGLAEFLPVSSSGHIQLLEQLFQIRIEESAMMLVTVLLHVGTLAVVVIVFWQDWLEMLKALLVKSRQFWLLVLASVPALVVKVLLGDVFDRLNGGGLLGVFFLVTAVMMWLVERISGGRHRAQGGEVGVRQALVMGCFQALGMMTGVSRSGSTTLGGVSSGLSRQKAIKFCFMMSAPAILGSLLVEGKDAAEAGAFAAIGSMTLPILVGMVCAFLVGMVTVRFMLRMINKISYNVFAVYMAVIGVATIVMQLIGVGGLKPLGIG